MYGTDRTLVICVSHESGLAITAATVPESRLSQIAIPSRIPTRRIKMINNAVVETNWLPFCILRVGQTVRKSLCKK